MPKPLREYIEEEIEAKSPFGTIIQEDLSRRVFAVENDTAVPYFKKKQQDHIIRRLAWHVFRYGAQTYTHNVHQEVGSPVVSWGLVIIYGGGVYKKGLGGGKSRFTPSKRSGNIFSHAEGGGEYKSLPR